MNFLDKFAAADDKHKLHLIKKLCSSSDIRAQVLLDEIQTMPLNPPIRAAIKKHVEALNKKRPPAPDSIKKAVRLLSSSDPGSRIQGILQAKKIGNPNTLPLLANYLRAEVNAHVASFLVTSIGALGGVRTLSLILKYIKNEDIRVQGNAVETIGEIVRRDITPGLAGFLDSNNNRVRANAALALYSPHQDRVRDVLMDMSGHDEINMRASAAWALGHIREIWSVEILEKLADDKQALVRKNALNSLSRLESFRASSALLRARSKVFGDAAPFAEDMEVASESSPVQGDAAATRKSDTISSFDSYALKFANPQANLEQIGQDVLKDAQLRLLDLSGDKFAAIRALLRDIAQLNRRKKETESRNSSSLWGKLRTKEDPALSYIEREISKKLRAVGAEMRQIISSNPVAV